MNELKFSLFEKRGKLTVFHNHITSASKIGLFFSGGIDSSTLLLKTILELKNTDIVYLIHCFIVDTHSHQTLAAIKIIDIFNSIYSCDIEYSVLSGEYINGKLDHSLCADVSINNKDMVFLHGLNNNSKIYYGSEEVVIWNKRIHYFPFLNMNKGEILSILFSLNGEVIIPYTVTCLFDKKCGNCYSCEERVDGFVHIGKQDCY